MKLRLHDGSVRLRLSPAEVAGLAEAGRVESETRIAPGAALTVVVCAGLVGQPTASLDGATLTVTVPHGEAVVWAEDDREGLTAEQDAGDGRTLQIAVEKDYACGHRAGATGTFPRPDARAR